MQLKYKHRYKQIYTDVNNPQRMQVCSEDFKRGDSQTDSEIFTSKAQLTFTNCVLSVDNQSKIRYYYRHEKRNWIFSYRNHFCCYR